MNRLTTLLTPNLKPIYLATLASAALLSGCAAPRQTPFNEADFRAAATRGSATLTGRAYITTEDHGTLYAHHQQIALWPVNAYTTENVQRRFLQGQKLQPADPRVAAYVRAVTTDNDGNFAIHGVPAGDYYLEGKIPWVTSSYETDNDGNSEWMYVNRYKYYFTRLTVKAGQTVRVTQFDQRSPEHHTFFSEGGTFYRPPAGAEVF